MAPVPHPLGTQSVGEAARLIDGLAMKAKSLLPRGAVQWSTGVGALGEARVHDRAEPPLVGLCVQGRIRETGGTILFAWCLTLYVVMLISFTYM